MRQKISAKALIVFGMVLFLTMGGTVAYFATSETAHNIVATSGVKIELYELDGPAGSKPFHDLENIAAGETYSKIPYVENIDLEPVWVRAKVLLKKVDNGSEALIEDYSALMTIQDLGANWIANTDGYYYYNSSLSSGEQTEPIFESVKFADSIGDEYQDATYSLTVATEATQVKNNGTSGLDASWTESGV